MRQVRSNEFDVARAHLDEALRGHGRSLFVTGAAGIGKSTFVEAVAATAPDAWFVVRVDGAELESRMVWAGLSQLIHRLRDHVPALSAAHQRIIESLVDPTAGRAPDAFAAAVSVYALLAQAADAAPTLVVVEDHHWLDPDSVRVLDFVARRLDGLRVLLIATSRSTDVAADTHLALEPLTPDEAAGVLIELGLGVVTARDLAAQIGGYPLALVQAANTLTADQRAGIDPLPAPFPMSADDLPSALVAVIRGLPADTGDALRLLSAAGVLGRGWPAVLAAAGVAVDALTPAE
ncbi:MAG: ATP-binding protein, partial [Actinobacteria bacterium]|nr:ATP-binding protein [Actinomycetota bacterium]